MAQIDTKAAALILGVSAGRVRQLLMRGELQSLGQFGGSTVFSQEAVEALADARRTAKTELTETKSPNPA